MDNFQSLDTPTLLRLYAEVMAEMKARGVSRGMNNPVADYAETLVAQAIGAEILPQSNAGYDLRGHEGTRFEVKARRMNASRSSRQLSALRGLELQKFDFLAGVLFNEDFTVHRAVLIPWAVVRAHATYVFHTNSWRFLLTDDIWQLPGVQNLELEMMASTTRIIRAASVLPARSPSSRRSSDGRDLTRFDLVGGSTSYIGLGKGRVLLALVRELAHCGVSPEAIGIRMPWARGFLWRSVEGEHTANSFVALAKEGTDRYFVSIDELIHFEGRTYALSTQWTASRFRRALVDLAGLCAQHGLAVRESGTDHVREKL